MGKLGGGEAQKRTLTIGLSDHERELSVSEQTVPLGVDVHVVGAFLLWSIEVKLRQGDTRERSGRGTSYSPTPMRFAVPISLVP